jgi:hypothetical protein
MPASTSTAAFALRLAAAARRPARRRCGTSAELRFAAVSSSGRLAGDDRPPEVLLRRCLQPQRRLTCSKERRRGLIRETVRLIEASSAAGSTSVVCPVREPALRPRIGPLKPRNSAVSGDRLFTSSRRRRLEISL